MRVRVRGRTRTRMRVRMRRSGSGSGHRRGRPFRRERRAHFANWVIDGVLVERTHSERERKIGINEEREREDEQRMSAPPNHKQPASNNLHRHIRSRCVIAVRDAKSAVVSLRVYRCRFVEE